ncbi:MAG: hypothetical protein F4Y20_06825 [Acidobacteria bacterium]|nr:hypothetical protein [Acidobacteriota bacterium]MYH21974.1 hypothetical protein [Acidobacteriota bacterium]MYK79627.1 hypothetical protein [Acidobacteriota bacterium]
MSVVSPRDGVLDLMQYASSRVVIAAPYIKSAAIRRLLEAIPSTVSECVCITRWLPEDIAAGACDIEVFDDVMQANGGRLLVHPHLHAKYYSNGKTALVGSANVTARGLGWHMPPNLELLVALPAGSPGLASWESSLLASAVEATEDLCAQIRDQAEYLRQNLSIQVPPEIEGGTGGKEDTVLWLPQCPTPERLWDVYRGRGADTMVSSAFEAAKSDLAALSPPGGLSQDLFTEYVAGILRQAPLIAEIDGRAVAGLADPEAEEFLLDHLGGGSGAVSSYSQTWQVVKRWLVHFFPESYRLETGPEVLVKGREISRR